MPPAKSAGRSVGAPPRTGAPTGGRPTIAGIPRTYVVVGLAALGGLVYIWYRNKQAAQAAASSGGDALGQTAYAPPGFYPGSPNITTTVSPSTPAGSGGPPSGTDPNAWPNIIQFGQYTPSEMVQIGTMKSGGQYTGQQVTSGTPVYANVYGGFVKSFNPATLPNGTGIWIPASFAQNESPSGGPGGTYYA